MCHGSEPNKGGRTTVKREEKNCTIVKSVVAILWWSCGGACGGRWKDGKSKLCLVGQGDDHKRRQAFLKRTNYLHASQLICRPSWG